MAALLPLELSFPCTQKRFTIPNSLPIFTSYTRLASLHYTTLSFSGRRHLKSHSLAAHKSETETHLVHSSSNLLPRPQVLARLAASAVLFLGLGFAFGARACFASSTKFPFLLPSESSTVQQDQSAQGISSPK